MNNGILEVLNEGDRALMAPLLRSRSFRKNDVLTVPGQVQRELYFVKSGVQTSYLDTNDKVHVIAFTYSPDICAVPDSFFFQRPAKCHLVCLTDSELDCLAFEDLQHLFDQSPTVERLFRKMTEAVLAGVIDRHMELQSLSMEQRFRAFGQRSPQLFHLVPHKYIASYLGIDATNFSKLYNSVRF